jgi:outer membrane lipoprotein LolB
MLHACSVTPFRPPESVEAAMAYQKRLDRLQSFEHWTLKGRLAISNGKDGGSGNLIWQNDGDETQISFHGAMGKGAWQLHASPAGARIELANGEVHNAPTLAALVVQEVGWQIPIDALSWWIKGLADPANWESRELDEKGQLLKLSQLGWEVEFGNYAEVSGSSLPAKLTAHRGKYLVKMVIQAWNVKAEAG